MLAAAHFDMGVAERDPTASSSTAVCTGAAAAAAVPSRVDPDGAADVDADEIDAFMRELDAEPSTRKPRVFKGSATSQHDFDVFLSACFKEAVSVDGVMDTCVWHRA